MFLNFNAFVILVLILFQSFFSLIQSEPIFKKPKPNICMFGFSKNSNKRCDTNKVIKCENRCDFLAHCSDMADELNCGQCDFTQDMCGWKSMDKTRLAWVKIDQNMRIQCNDSENQNCVLSLLKDKSNTNNLMKLSNKARIQSPKFQATPKSCNFEFAYLHNENDCLLSVRLVDENRKLWFRDKLNIMSQNDRNWRLESVDIGNIASGFQMEFLVDCDEKLTNRKPDKSFIEIAIKNTSWSDCESNSNKLYINDFDCDFKTNLCHKWTDFELISDKLLHWKRSNNYLKFGKNFDYKSNEYFVYTEKQDNKNTSLIARLSSLDRKSNDSQISLSFDYLIKNIVNSSLYVLIKEKFNGKEKKLEIWKSKLSKSSKWQNMCLNITTKSSIYQIIFEAHFEAFDSGLFAIKNIKQLNDKFCTNDHISDETSNSTLFTDEFNTEQIPITTFEINNTEIPSIVTTNLSINEDFNVSNVREYNKIDSNFRKNFFNESIVWNLRGIAFLTIVLIFFYIRWCKKKKRNEDLVPLTYSHDIHNNRSNISETD